MFWKNQVYLKMGGGNKVGVVCFKDWVLKLYTFIIFNMLMVHVGSYKQNIAYGKR